jgi:hypothetical protein
LPPFGSRNLALEFRQESDAELQGYHQLFVNVHECGDLFQYGIWFLWQFILQIKNPYIAELTGCGAVSVICVK